MQRIATNLLTCIVSGGISVTIWLIIYYLLLGGHIDADVASRVIEFSCSAAFSGAIFLIAASDLVLANRLYTEPNQAASNATARELLATIIYLVTSFAVFLYHIDGLSVSFDFWNIAVSAAVGVWIGFAFCGVLTDGFLTRILP